MLGATVLHSVADLSGGIPLTSLRDPAFRVVGKAFWLCQLEGFIPPRLRIVATSALGFFATFGFILASLVQISGQKHTDSQ
jgi:hypothetical protein